MPAPPASHPSLFAQHVHAEMAELHVRTVSAESNLPPGWVHVSTETCPPEFAVSPVSSHACFFTVADASLGAAQDGHPCTSALGMLNAAAFVRLYAAEEKPRRLMARGVNEKVEAGSGGPGGGSLVGGGLGDGGGGEKTLGDGGEGEGGEGGRGGGGVGGFGGGGGGGLGGGGLGGGGLGGGGNSLGGGGKGGGEGGGEGGGGSATLAVGSSGGGVGKYRGGLGGSGGGGMPSGAGGGGAGALMVKLSL